MDILRHRSMLFLWLLISIFGMRCCACSPSSPNQEQEPKNTGQNLSHSPILATEPCTAESTLSRKKVIESSHSRKGQEINIDYADVIGSGPQYYGVEYSWIDQDKDIFLDRYRKLHGNVVRVQISQELFESKKDNINFSRTISIDSRAGKTMTYENMFKSLVTEFPDMHFQINVWLCAKWNATDPNGYFGIGGAFPPKDYAEHREFIRELARWLVGECGIPPDHLSFTFINEANLKSFFVGNQNDLFKMAKETRIALDQISSSIKMGGLDEVHGTTWSDKFYRKLSNKCCDIWTFHVYERGLSAVWGALYKRTKRLGQYGPVWVTEFADTKNGSPDAEMNFSTREAALEFSELLGRLWPSGINGIIHFRLADTYVDYFGGWVGHGLFSDSRGTLTHGRPYEPYPVYWVFSNFYRELGGRQLVKTTASKKLTVVAARKVNNSTNQLTVWVSNYTKNNYNILLRIANFPSKSACVEVIDNLAGDTPIENSIVKGDVLSFNINIPLKSSFLFIIK